jgi:hypothetical protein
LHEVAHAADIHDYLVWPTLDQLSAKLPNHGAIIEYGQKRVNASDSTPAEKFIPIFG